MLSVFSPYSINTPILAADLTFASSIVLVFFLFSFLTISPFHNASNSHMKKKHTTNILAVVALQDHLVRSLNLTAPTGCCHSKPASHDKGANRANAKAKRSNNTETANSNTEYVLEASQPVKLSLAQKMGIIEAPKSRLSEDDWLKVKCQSSRRADSQQPCPICHDEFDLREQVLLSCSHVFHRACLQAFERHSGKKTCPMCRRADYETRVIHEGSRAYRVRCATKIQALWRGHIVRQWYRQVRTTRPPQDPLLRRKFYEQKLAAITERVLRSMDFERSALAEFMGEVDRNLERSRWLMASLDAKLAGVQPPGAVAWTDVETQARARGCADCPICLGRLHLPPASAQPSAPANRKPLLLLSCSHVFHKTCFDNFERFLLFDMPDKLSCPVCRSSYLKKVL